MAVTEEDEVHSWGCGAYGLGHGDEEPLLVLTKLECELLGGSGVVMVAAGMCHSIVVTTEGAVFAWGGRMHGQLGLGYELQRLTPMRVGAEEAFDVARVITAGADLPLRNPPRLREWLFVADNHFFEDTSLQTTSNAISDIHSKFQKNSVSDVKIFAP